MKNDHLTYSTFIVFDSLLYEMRKSNLIPGRHSLKLEVVESSVHVSLLGTKIISRNYVKMNDNIIEVDKKVIHT